MALSIKHPEAEKLARALASKTGENITETIIKALQERLIREEGKSLLPQLKDELLKISQRCSALPDLDKRSPDEILGYDQHGLPGGSNNGH